METRLGVDVLVRRLLICLAACGVSGPLALSERAAGAPSGEAKCVDLFSAAPGSPAQPGHDPNQLAVGDFNGDRIVDLVIGRYINDAVPGPPDPGAVVPLWGSADGRFASGPVTTIQSPSGLVAAELTGDALSDVAVSQWGFGELALLRGDATAGLLPYASVLAAEFARVYGTGDVNGDGSTEIAVIEQHSSPNSGESWELRLLSRAGAGAFSDGPGSSVPLQRQVADVTVDDLDSDGLDDVAVAYTADTDPVDVFLGAAEGGLRRVAHAVAWQPRPPHATPYPSFLRVADVDGDGRRDLVAATTGGSRPLVLRNLGSGRFRELSGAGVEGPGPDSLATGRFNADKFADVALSFRDYTEESATLTVLLGNAQGGFDEAPGSPEHPGASAYSLTAADLNADGVDDLAMIDRPTADSGTVPILLNTKGKKRPGARVPIHIEIKSESFGAVTYGDELTIAAGLHCEPGARAGRRLALRRRIGGRGQPWRHVKTLVTRADGRAAFVDRPSASAAYRWRAADRVRPRLRRSKSIAIGVAREVEAVLKVRRIIGRVRPAQAGERVFLEKSNGQGQDEKEWTRVGSAVLTSTGRFSFDLPALGYRRGTFQVVAPRDDRFLRGTSDEFTVF
jgi:hypothetical protein